MANALVEFRRQLKPTLDRIHSIAQKPHMGITDRSELSRSLNRLVSSTRSFLSQSSNRKQDDPIVQKWTEGGFSIQGLSTGQLRSIYRFSKATVLTQMVQQFLGDAAGSIVLESEVLPSLHLPSGEVFVALDKKSGPLESFRKELLEASTDEFHRLEPLASNIRLLGHARAEQFLSAGLIQSGVDAIHASAHHALGSVLLEQGHPVAALDHFNRAATIDPQNSFRWSCKLMAHVMNPDADPESSIADAKKAVQLNRFSPLARDLSGLVHIKFGYLLEGLKQVRRAVSLVPHDPALRHSLGIAHRRVAYQSEIARSPEAESQYRSSLRAMKTVYEQTGEPEDLLSLAEAHYRLGHHLLAKYGQTHEKSYAIARHLDHALGYYEKAIGDEPTAENLRRLAELYLLQRKDFQRALKCLSISDRLEPGDATTQELIDRAIQLRTENIRMKSKFN